MEPTFKNGSIVLVNCLIFAIRKPKVGEVVVFTHSGKEIIKRVVGLTEKGYLVAGDNGSDSKDFGPIKRQALLGKVVGKLS